MTTINENTKVGLGLTVALLGGVGWLTNIYFLADSTAKAMDQVQKKQDTYSTDLSEVKADLRVIKAQQSEIYLIIKDGNRHGFYNQLSSPVRSASSR